MTNTALYSCLVLPLSYLVLYNLTSQPKLFGEVDSLEAADTNLGAFAYVTMHILR